ncbi:hypothetical protein HK096_006222 [Nowakowskiella sp. JEL0078]|nr:hypothetical protein HK096_006222 [Nowakowskiella sp. JEL0078]
MPRNSSFLLFALFALFFNSFAYAADVGAAVVSTLTVSSGIIAAIYIIVGLLFVFAGYKLFRIVLFAIGFFIGNTLAYIVLANIDASANWSEWVFFIAAVVVGILFGFLFLCFYKLGIAGLGAFFGFVLASYILSFKAGGLISSSTGRIIFIVILVVIGLVVALFIEKIAIIVSTSVIGSVGAFVGIDVFAKTGVSQIIISFVSANGRVTGLADTISVAQYAILIAIAVLAIIGIVIQFRHNKGDHDSHRNKGLYRRAPKKDTGAV